MAGKEVFSRKNLKNLCLRAHSKAMAISKKVPIWQVYTFIGSFKTGFIFSRNGKEIKGWVEIFVELHAQ